MKRKFLLAALPLLMVASAQAQEKTETSEEAKPACCKTGTNILYFSPMKFTENGVGFELGYEHGLDAGGIVAVNLPLVATFNMSNGNLDKGNKQDAMFYFTPGIKFYPTSSFGKVKYSLGPSLVLAAGEETQNFPILNTYPAAYYNTYTDNYITKSKVQLGVMINNSLNINPTAHFTMGLDFGFGFTYITKIDGETQNMRGLVQGGFKLGYRL